MATRIVPWWRPAAFARVGMALVPLHPLRGGGSQRRKQRAVVTSRDLLLLPLRGGGWEGGVSGAATHHGDRIRPHPNRPAGRSAPGVRMACTAVPCKQALPTPALRGMELEAGDCSGACRRRSYMRLPPASPRNLRGLCRRPFSQTSRCTWAPVERPVEPALAICWPTRTRSPTFTVLRELCA